MDEARLRVFARAGCFFSGSEFIMKCKLRKSARLAFLLALAHVVSAGPPHEIRPGLSGLWTFHNPESPGLATIGADLTVVGGAPQWFSVYQDDRLSPRIQRDVIVTVAGPGNHLRIPHGIGPNGNGQKTNVFTLVFDVLASSPRDQWHALYQTSLDNGDDAEYFIRRSNSRLGISGLVYSDDSLPRDQWNRIVLSVDLDQGRFFRTYVNGALFMEHTAPARDSRWALDPDEVLFFADDNDENQPLAVAAVAVFSRALTAAEAGALGDPGVCILRATGEAGPQPEWVDPPHSVTVGEWTRFGVRAAESGGLPVQFQVEWSDGRVSDWSDMLPAGETHEFSHVWLEAGDFTPVLRARDMSGAVSEAAAHTLNAAFANTPGRTSGLKVITYNTFDHFAQGTRKQETVGWLREQRPDILALQELSNLTNDALADLSRGWGHGHAAVLREAGWTLGLTSRFPIENVIRHTAGYHRGVLQVRTGGYEVFVVHKSPYNRQQRLEDLARIAPWIQAALSAGRPVIVLGDFNAHSEADAEFLSGQTRLVDWFPAAHLHDGAIDFQVMQGFFDLGLSDAARRFGFESITYPTPLRPAHRPLSEQAWRAEPIDYILTCPILTPRTILFTARERLLDFTSDHYPVVAHIAHPEHSYYRWTEDFGDLADAYPFADPRGDGAKNLLVFVLDGDPTTAGSTWSPRFHRGVEGQRWFEFTRRADSAPVTRQTLLESRDLVSWWELEVYPEGGPPFEILPDPDDPNTERVRFHLDPDDADYRFFRLDVRMNIDT